MLRLAFVFCFRPFTSEFNRNFFTLSRWLFVFSSLLFASLCLFRFYCNASTTSQSTIRKGHEISVIYVLYALLHHSDKTIFTQRFIGYNVFVFGVFSCCAMLYCIRHSVFFSAALTSIYLLIILDGGKEDLFWQPHIYVGSHRKPKR